MTSLYLTNYIVKTKIDDSQVNLVLNQCSVVMIGHINVTVLLEYLMKRRNFTPDEICTLKQQQSPRNKALKLHQILTRKGVNGFFEFYASLLESYMMEDGVDGHYTLIKAIERRSKAQITYSCVC